MELLWKKKKMRKTFETMLKISQFHEISPRFCKKVLQLKVCEPDFWQYIESTTGQMTAFIPFPSTQLSFFLATFNWLCNFLGSNCIVPKQARLKDQLFLFLYQFHTPNDVNIGKMQFSICFDSLDDWVLCNGCSKSSVNSCQFACYFNNPLLKKKSRCNKNIKKSCRERIRSSQHVPNIVEIKHTQKRCDSNVCRKKWNFL